MLLIFAATSQQGFSLSIEPECNITANSYAVMQSHLEYTDVSTTYARSIYNDVRDIVWGYLADPDISWFCFFEPYYEKAGRLLDLVCEVKRTSYDVLLSVRIYHYDTQEPLLLFETTAPFFQPAAAVASLAATLRKSRNSHV